MPPRRVAPECANPLFLKWLEELRDGARERGLKMADVYTKACRSLAACPVSYERPRELAQLKGIGPKTVAILEKRLRTHCEESGEAYPVTPRKSAPQAPPDDCDDDDEPNPPPKKRKAAVPKAYIPQQGSGPYGILIGLLLSISDPTTTIQVFLTKGELIRVAQKYCHSSYDHSERGSFATAWNGMKTLINKGYVIVQGSPHRYCLTEDGYDVAVTLRNMHPDFADSEKLTPLERAGNSSVSVATTTASVSATRAPSVSSTTSMAQPLRRVSSGAKFQFWYIDSAGKRVLELSAAQLRLDPKEFVTLRRIEFRASQKTHPIVSQLRQLEDGQTSVYGYIVEDNAPPRCSCFDDDDEDDILPTVGLSSRTSALPRPADPTAPARRSVPPAPPAPPARTMSMDADMPVAGPSRPRPPQLPLLGETQDATGFDPSDAITFPHGSYDIVLILDSREVESRSNRDKLAESLTAKGVRVETRALRLGDMCWVARLRDGHGGEEDECVLDYVVERKRLDDLCSSIRDGRYREQCFRLNQSGIGNVFYVVEDWQVAMCMEHNGKQIWTAKSQIQVINGFFLKETHKLSDTIDFLATMTRVITSSHRDLKVIPSRYLSRPTYVGLQEKLRKSHPKQAFLTSFDAYQSLNDKSASRTLGESLGRMLLCIKGMSPERVSAMLDKWETPRALYEAMCARHALGIVGEGKKARGPENFFADEVGGEGRRKIGEALSRELWKCLWGE